VGDGVGIWKKQGTIGNKIDYIYFIGQRVNNAKKGSIVKVNLPGAEDGDKIYKTSVDTCQKTGTKIPRYKREPIRINRKKISGKVALPQIKKNVPEKAEIKTEAEIHVKVKDIDGLKEAIKYKPKAIYYPIDDEKVIEARGLCKKGFFLYTKKVLDDKEIIDINEKISKIRPDGILVSNMGLRDIAKKDKVKITRHFDYNLNVFNDIDLLLFDKPIISPELNLRELSSFSNK
jgi:hypothetical protein